MKSLKRFIKTSVPAVLAFMSVTVQAYADNLSSSTVGTGIRNILNDLSSFGMVICPIVGGAAAVYFLIRRSMADEQDGKMWSRRIWVAILCGVGGLLVSGIISLISSYF
ncbi:MAG: hypothetical protein VB064_11710 [Oscillospiraceae bacterium]|nr:hypothetical protein [Oscillospiraceae bacterium]